MAEDKETGSSTGRWLRRFMSGEPQDREELAEMLREVSQRNVIDSDALGMLEGVLDVAEMQVRDIMVPRSQITAIQREAPVTEILPIVVESGHSRFPVVGDDRDQVFGILLAKDLLRLYVEDKADEFDIKEFLRPAVVVPESKRLNVLLKEFRASHNHMAIVVDEYGGVSGLVTIEDVIEQIVGEIDDEYDIEEDQLIRRESDRQFMVRAVTRIDEFNEYFGTELTDEDFDTIGGLVTHSLGRLPRRGESVNVSDMEFRVVRADRRRIDTLRVTVPQAIPPHADDESG